MGKLKAFGQVEICDPPAGPVRLCDVGGQVVLRNLTIQSTSGEITAIFVEVFDGPCVNLPDEPVSDPLDLPGGTGAVNIPEVPIDGEGEWCVKVWVELDGEGPPYASATRAFDCALDNEGSCSGSGAGCAEFGGGISKAEATVSAQAIEKEECGECGEGGEGAPPHPAAQAGQRKKGDSEVRGKREAAEPNASDEGGEQQAAGAGPGKAEGPEIASHGGDPVVGPGDRVHSRYKLRIDRNAVRFEGLALALYLADTIRLEEVEVFYDVDSSTPYVAIWKSDCCPEGQWALRLRRHGAIVLGQLTLQWVHPNGTVPAPYAWQKIGFLFDATSRFSPDPPNAQLPDVFTIPA
ncbi:MAG: hypothetical protein ACXW34_10345 [Nitrospira sp.]